MIVTINGKKYLKLFHRNSKDRDGYTLKDFIEAENILYIKAKELFKINKEHLFIQMTSEFKRALSEKFGVFPKSADDVKIDMPLPTPCYVLIPIENVDTDTAISSTNFQDESADFGEFYEERLAEIISDPAYVKEESFAKGEERAFVFGWFKSRANLKNDRNAVPEFFDLSKYIVSLNTNVTMNGGTFSIRLPYVEPFRITKDGDKSVFVSTGSAINRTDLGGDESFDYFSNMIGTNDLLFISFEALQMDNREKLSKSTSTDEFIANLDTGVFDMIALVDSVSIEKDYTTSTAFVNVQGRDLMKLLTDDGSYYYNLSMTSFAEEIFGNKDDIMSGDEFSVLKKNGALTKPVDRLRFFSGGLIPFANVRERRIRHIINTVITLLANIEICPDYLFNGYGDKRNKGVELKFK